MSMFEWSLKTGFTVFVHVRLLHIESKQLHLHFTAFSPALFDLIGNDCSSLRFEKDHLNPEYVIVL